MLVKKIGERVRDIRMQKDLTQQQLANLSHIGIKTIQLIETGSHNSTIKTLESIAKALRIDIDDLFSKKRRFW